MRVVAQVNGKNGEFHAVNFSMICLRIKRPHLYPLYQGSGVVYPNIKRCCVLSSNHCSILALEDFPS